MESEKGYLWSAFTIGVIAVLLLWLSAPSQQVQAHGILLPSGVSSSRSVAVDKVSLISRLPLNAKVLGHINIEMNFSPKNLQQQQLLIVTKVKQLASSVGANLVVVKMAGSSGPGGDVNRIWIFKGLAVSSSQPFVATEPGPVIISQ